MKRKIIWFILVFLLIPLLYVNPIYAEPKNVYIDSKIPIKYHAQLEDIMLALDESDRENVLLIFEDGSFTGNKSSIVEEFEKQNKEILLTKGKLVTNANIDSQVSVKSKNTVRNLSYTNPSLSCPSANSGPFRRVTSKSGYSRLTSNIYLPSKSSGEVFMNTYTNDKGYIYTGAKTTGGAIDIGLSLNYPSGSSPWNETWGMFIAGQSNVTQPEYGNFKLGQTVFLKYYTPMDNYAALYVAGMDKNGNFDEKTLVAQISSSKEFKSSGTGMQLKRVTSIAQTPENLTSGSYLKNVTWSNVKIGTTSGSEVPMSDINTESFCGYKTSNVMVDFLSQSWESVWVKAGTLP